jgi:GWxTD domain-containing protein
MVRFGVLGLLSCLAFAASADEREDKLPEPYKKWLLEEVPYIISKVEREVFLGLQSEQEREAFVEAFWRKRDENPSTPENEYRTEHYRRLEYANEFLGRDTSGPGWRTDRGRYYILLGAPRNRLYFDANDEVYPSELWFFDNPDLKRFGLPPFFSLLFFRRHGAGEMEIYSPVLDGPQALLTGTDTKSADFRQDVERAYNKLYEVDPELAQASLSFRTDEGDTAQFQAVSFGTMALMDQIVKVPFHGLDTSYAERLDFERGAVESDYLFTYVPSEGAAHVLPGPDGASYVHWVIELLPEHIAFVLDKETGVYGSAFIVTTEAVRRDDPNKVALQSRNESFVRLKESEKASLHRPFAYSGMTPLVPGTYDFRVILRNRACPSRDEKTCVKSYTLLDRQIEAPSWPEEKAALSEPVLGYETVVRDGAPLYRAYRFGNLEIRPNTSGVYSIGETMTVAIEHWNVRAGGEVRFRIVSEEPPGETVLDETVSLMEPVQGPLVQELSLAGLQGGRFRLIASLLNDGGVLLAETGSSFTVSPRTEIPRPFLRAAGPQVRPEVPGLVDSMLGEQYLALEETDRAKESFERSLERNPKLGLARERLAGLAMSEGDYPKVVALLEPVYAEVRDRYEILAPLGEAYFRTGANEKAVELLEKAIVLRRPQPSLLNALANAQYRLGNLPRALQLLEQSIGIDPNQPQVKELIEKLKAELAARQ